MAVLFRDALAISSYYLQSDVVAKAHNPRSAWLVSVVDVLLHLSALIEILHPCGLRRTDLSLLDYPIDDESDYCQLLISFARIGEGS